MANNDELVLVHSNVNNHQPPPTNLAILPIGPPLEEALDPNDDEEMKEAIQVNKFYDVLEN